MFDTQCNDDSTCLGPSTPLATAIQYLTLSQSLEIYMSNPLLRVAPKLKDKNVIMSFPCLKLISSIS